MEHLNYHTVLNESILNITGFSCSDASRPLQSLSHGIGLKIVYQSIFEYNKYYQMEQQTAPNLWLKILYLMKRQENSPGAISWKSFLIGAFSSLQPSKSCGDVIRQLRCWPWNHTVVLGYLWKYGVAISECLSVKQSQLPDPSALWAHILKTILWQTLYSVSHINVFLSACLSFTFHFASQLTIIQ